MRPLLTLFCFFLVTFQRFIIQESHYQNCSTSVINGQIITPGICFEKMRESFQIFKHFPSYFQHEYDCNRNCTSCKIRKVHNYGCEKVGDLMIQTRYGIPKPIKEKGFYYEEFFDVRLCDEAQKIPHTLFYIDETCVNVHNQTFKSYQIGFLDFRNIIEYKEFRKDNCEGDLAYLDYRPLKHCYRPRGRPMEYSILFRKEF